MIVYESISNETHTLDGELSYLQSNLLSKYLKSTQGLGVLVIRGTCYQYWLICSVHELGTTLVHVI